MADGTLIFDTKLDTDGLSTEVNKLTKSTSAFGDVMKGVLGANLVQQAGEKLIDFAKDAITAASDLQEVQNVVDVTFGESADIINDFAIDGAKAFGLTELQTKRYAGTLGSLFKSMGLGQDEVTEFSVSMAGLVGDMASFYNLDYETAFEKLRSGISGETEPLKQLGVNMSVANLEAFALAQGIKTSYEEMTEAQKATLRYQYIMEATADAQGDFNRTQDSFANQMRTLSNNFDTLKTSLGTNLLPVVNGVVSAINGLFNWSPFGEESELQKEINAAADSLNGIDEAILGLKNKYANTMLKIGVEYTSSQQLLDDYAALSGIEDKSESQIEQMKTLVADLVALYPSLSEHVGENGLFKKEADEVATLIEQYKALAEQRAYMELVEGIYTEYNKAKFEVNTLGEKALTAQGQIAELEKQKAALESLYETIQNAPELRFNWYNDLQSGNMDPKRVQEAADAVQAYLDAFGTFDQSTLDDLSSRGVDISSFINSLGDTSQLDDTGIIALFETLGSLSSQDNVGTELENINTQLTAAQTAATTAAQALADGIGVLQSAQTELDAALAAYSATTGDTTSEIVQTIDATLKEGGVTIATSAGDINADIATSLSDPTTIQNAMNILLGVVDSAITNYIPPDIVVNVRYNDPGYSGSSGGTASQSLNGKRAATGLDWVPYDEFPALLHRGEAVLRADDAARWRSGQSGSGDNTAALAAVAQSMEAVAARPVKVYVGKKEIITAVSDGMYTEMNNISRTHARGVGK